MYNFYIIRYCKRNDTEKERRMVYNLDITNYKEKKITSLSDNFRGKDPEGNEISFTNYYMKINGEPFLESVVNVIFLECMKTGGRILFRK